MGLPSRIANQKYGAQSLLVDTVLGSTHGLFALPGMTRTTAGSA